MGGEGAEGPFWLAMRGAVIELAVVQGQRGKAVLGGMC
jgi:hypothetical protein